MLETKAVFRRKDTEIGAEDCVVENVIRLPGAEFDIFARNLTRDRDFIRDNPLDIGIDERGRRHCLLIVGEGRRDGILVSSEGYDYARYSAFLPNAEAWLSLERYPAIGELAQKLERTLKRAEGLLEEAVNKAPADESVPIDLDALGAMSDIDFDYNQILLDTVVEMIGTLPGVASAELDDRELILYRDTASTERSAQAAPDKAAADFGAAALAKWREAADRTAGSWREDIRYRQHKDGALYYLGGESGRYMRLSNDGKLTLGRYDYAKPGIADAVLTAAAVLDAGGYEAAVLLAARLGGSRFLSDLDGMAKYMPPETARERSSVLKQIREAKTAPKAPRKQKTPGKHRDGEEL